ncbi:MAG TPA: glycosyltransferase family 2 protein [Bryobacteraceae bacterium]|jgi:dolichol-phosphate mannosyltransferase
MLLSVVVPVFNEEAVLPAFMGRLQDVLRDLNWELIFVDDGSTDRSALTIHGFGQSNDRVKLLRLSRNFGHQVAVTAGLDFAQGDAVVVMDADLQDPPELIPAMLRLLDQGFDVVSPQRFTREGESAFKIWSARLFYHLMGKLSGGHLSAEVGDFRLFSRKAVLALRAMREQHRFMRGMVGWLGLPETLLPFERQPRVAGETKYPLLKMLRFAWTAVSSFSAVPLRLSLGVGVLLSCAGFLYLLKVIYMALWGVQMVPGWATVVVFQCIFSGMILIALGAIGDYVARTYEETKGRPLYVVGSTFNLCVPQEGIQRAVLPDAGPGPIYVARKTA